MASLSENVVTAAIDEILSEPRRRFLESVEVQIAIHRPGGASRRLNTAAFLPFQFRRLDQILIFVADENAEIARAAGASVMTVTEMRAFRRNRRAVKSAVKRFSATLADRSIVRRIPRLLGPQLSRMGMFPTAIDVADPSRDSYEKAIKEAMRRFRFQTRNNRRKYTFSGKVATVEMPLEIIVENVVAAAEIVRETISVTGPDDEPWGVIRKMVVKSSMGRPHVLYERED